MIGIFVLLVTMYRYVFSTVGLNENQWFALVFAAFIETVIEFVFFMFYVQFIKKS